MEKKKAYSVEEDTKLINHLFENSNKTKKNINLSNNSPIKEIENKEKIEDDFEQKEEDQEIINAKGVKEKEEFELKGNYIYLEMKKMKIKYIIIYFIKKEKEILMINDVKIVIARVQLY